MTSDFALAREHLELAWLKLVGDDTTSVEVREAIDLLLDRVAAAEHRMNLFKAEVPAFRPTSGQKPFWNM
jgi:ectoine hydroxylase-related dioxygenase (phytanoyl-CoA dioxygenase family)